MGRHDLPMYALCSMQRPLERSTPPARCDSSKKSFRSHRERHYSSRLCRNRMVVASHASILPPQPATTRIDHRGQYQQALAPSTIRQGISQKHQLAAFRHISPDRASESSGRRHHPFHCLYGAGVLVQRSWWQ